MNSFGMFQLNKRSKQPYGNNNIIALQTNNDKQQTRNSHKLQAKVSRIRPNRHRSKLTFT